MSKEPRSKRDSATQPTEEPAAMRRSEGALPGAAEDSEPPCPRIDDLFGDYSEQTGAFFG